MHPKEVLHELSDCLKGATTASEKEQYIERSIAKLNEIKRDYTDEYFCLEQLQSKTNCSYNLNASTIQVFSHKNNIKSYFMELKRTIVFIFQLSIASSAIITGAIAVFEALFAGTFLFPLLMGIIIAQTICITMGIISIGIEMITRANITKRESSMQCKEATYQAAQQKIDINGLSYNLTVQNCRIGQIEKIVEMLEQMKEKNTVTNSGQQVQTIYCSYEATLIEEVDKRLTKTIR